MRTHVRLLQSALAALLVLGATPAPPVSAAEPSERAGAPHQPVLTRYTGTFKAELVWSRYNEYGGVNYELNKARIAVSGTMPAVRFSDTHLLGSQGSGRISTTGTVGSEMTTGDGDTQVDCAGDSVSPATSVPPVLVPIQGKDTLYAFSSLSAPMTCTSNQPPEQYDELEELPALPVPVLIKPSTVGTPVITVPINRRLPDESCPRYAYTPRASCIYRLKGTLTLRLVPDIDVFTAPTRAHFDRNASRASVSTRCGASCTATVTVRPLRGPGSATRGATLRPRAARTITVPLAAAVRTAVLKSGGARLTVTYRTGRVSRAFTQRLRT